MGQRMGGVHWGAAAVGMALLAQGCSGEDASAIGGTGPAGGAGAGGTAGSAGTAGTAGSGGGGCESGILCGATLECCEVGYECLDGECLPPCDSGLRCGPDSECCDADALCIEDECVTPGDPCIEAMDCAEDEYCDPTLGRCLPRGSNICEYYPPPGVFEPEQQWAWTGSSTQPSSIHVMMAPVVGDLDGDTIPEVAFHTYTSSGGYGGAGVLRVIRGDSGEELFSVTSPVVCPEFGLALGDLDGDGLPEIVSGGPCTGGRIMAFRNDGTLWWQSENANGTPYTISMEFGAPSIADLDGDGLGEVIVGGAVLEHNGVLRWQARPIAAYNCCGATPRGPVTAVYDVDADGELEVVAGNAVWRADGSVLWEKPGEPDGYVAVADFYLDDAPDIVVVRNGNIYIRLGSDGTLLWGPIVLPGGGRGGPPTVADFDGDGLPEIGVAGGGAYAVFDPDGSEDVLWSQPTQDLSSNITGSSVFDFDGDGQAEVVYNDECYMRVYQGTDGTVLSEVQQNSHTLIEYPLIVDVDGDDNTEIVFAGNAAVNRCSHIPGYTGLQAGIRVFSDALDNWVGTRRVWNQHTYHITNVRQDLRLPASEQANWRRYNSFRKNPQSFDAPDLVPADLDGNASACPPTMALEVEVENHGAVSVPAGLSVTFYAGTVASPGRLLATVQTDGPIVPGSSELVVASFEPEPAEMDMDVPWFVRVDDVGDGTGEHNECIETNNEAESTFRCDSNPE